jgi:hypothetical protein
MQLSSHQFPQQRWSPSAQPCHLLKTIERRKNKSQSSEINQALSLGKSYQYNHEIVWYRDVLKMTRSLNHTFSTKFSGSKWTIVKNWPRKNWSLTGCNTNTTHRKTTQSTTHDVKRKRNKRRASGHELPNRGYNKLTHKIGQKLLLIRKSSKKSKRRLKRRGEQNEEFRNEYKITSNIVFLGHRNLGNLHYPFQFLPLTRRLIRLGFCPSPSPVKPGHGTFTSWPRYVNSFFWIHVQFSSRQFSSVQHHPFFIARCRSREAV